MSLVRNLKALQPYVHRALSSLDPIASVINPAENTSSNSLEPVHLVILVHPKDSSKLPHCLEFARANIAHPISETTLIGPENATLIKLANEHSAQFIAEDQALPISATEVKDQLLNAGFELWTWIYQQLLKLNVDTVLSGDNFLIIDCDTLLLKRTVFKKGGQLVQQFSHERNHLYLKAYRELLGSLQPYRFSFVTHFMFSERRILKDFRNTIEEKTGKHWVKAILDLADSSIWDADERSQKPFNFFSEYEAYGNFARAHYYPKAKTRYFFNHGATNYDAKKESPDQYAKRCPKIYRWVSFHGYYYDESSSNKVSLETTNS